MTEDTGQKIECSVVHSAETSPNKTVTFEDDDEDDDPKEDDLIL